MSTRRPPTTRVVVKRGTPWFSACFSPQTKLLQRAPGGLLVSLFGTSVLLDERHIAIKGQLLPMEPFDQDLLDERPPIQTSKTFSGAFTKSTTS